ncbi:hypothetical protein D3C73_1580130 [compost metagenome]
MVRLDKFPVVKCPWVNNIYANAGYLLIQLDVVADIRIFPVCLDDFGITFVFLGGHLLHPVING